MDTLTPQKNLPLLFLGGLVLLTIATAFIPAKWFGIEPKSITRARLDSLQLHQATLQKIRTTTTQSVGRNSLKAHLDQLIEVNLKDKKQTLKS